MKGIGIVLIIVGIVGLLYGGIQYDRQRTVLKLGDLEAKATETKHVPVPPAVGAVALAGGLVLLLRTRRRA